MSFWDFLMPLRMLHNISEAALVAAKNALVLAPVQAVVGAVTIAATSIVTEVQGADPYILFGSLAPRLVAMAFAVIGALWRWHRFRLSSRIGMSGCAFSMVLAFIIGDGQVPYADFLTKQIAKESIPMMNGFLMGLFGLLLVTGVQDFMAAYRAKKGEQA